MSRLSFSGYGAVDLPVEVRRWDMTLVRRAFTSDTVELEPGNYVVLVHFPNGQQAHQYVQVEPGQKQRVSFLHAPRESVGVPTTKSTHSHPLTLHIERSLNAVAIRLRETDMRRAQRMETQIACYAGNPLQGTCRVVPPALVGDPVRTTAPHRRIERQVWYRLGRRTGDSQSVLQVTRAGTAGRHLILPDDALQVDMWLRPTEPPQLHAHLRDSALDTTLQFLWQGDSESAAEIAIRYTASKPDLPHLVYLYTLLRANELQRLGEWVKQLTTSKHGADGVVIRSEFYARIGNPQESMQTLLRMPSFGLPTFTEGFTLAMNRLRLYVVDGDAFSSEQREEAATLLQTLSAFELNVDYAQPILTYTGRCPDEPSEEPVSPEEWEGLV